MAAVRTKINEISRTGLMEFICDEVGDVKDAPTTTSVGKGVFSNCKYHAPLGSTLIVGNKDGETLVYMLFSFGWKQI